MVSIGFRCLVIIMEDDELCEEPKELRCEGEGIVSKEMCGCGKEVKRPKVIDNER